jgi:hypothetical protein
LHTVLEVKKEFPNTPLEGADPMNPWTRVVVLSLITGVAVISAAQGAREEN